MNLTNGVAGSGKAFKLTNDIINLLKSSVLPSEILVLAYSLNQKNKLNNLFNKNNINISVYTIDEFPRILSLEHSDFNYKNILSDYLAIQIIKSISEKELTKNSALKNLLKSKTFYRELYNLFGLFKNEDISYEELESINCQISSEDYNRFKIFLNIYKKYLQTLYKLDLKDYRDIFISILTTLKSNEKIKKKIQDKYKYCFIYGSENFSPIQIKIIEEIITNQRINIFGDNNSKINSFINTNSFNENEYNLQETNNNKEILSRALFILQNETELTSFSKSDAINYALFNDFSSEIDYIVKDIKNKIERGYKYSDIAILIRNNSLKSKIGDLIKSYSIPINTISHNEDCYIFKNNFQRLLNIFEIALKLNLKNFNIESFTSIKEISRSNLEIYTEQFNLLFENYIQENNNNSNFLNKISSTEKSNKTFITINIFNNIKNYTEEEKEEFFNLIKKLNHLYNLFLQNDFEFLIKQLYTQSDNKFFNNFIDKLIIDINKFKDLKINKLQEKINIKSLIELIEFKLEDSDNEDNSIHLLTIFKGYGKTYKKVYIPNLTEDYFPQKHNSTQFISEDANLKISNIIQEKHPDFKKLIMNKQDEIEQEKKLLYVALNCAKEEVLLSTHTFEDKKQVAPSPFFEQLRFVDEENFFFKKIQIDEQPNNQTNKEQKNTLIEKEYEKLLNENDKIYLSASSINTFLTCPKKFYYTKLLNLKEDSSFNASYGTIVHLIFELAYRNYLKHYSKELFLELSEILFNSIEFPEKALEYGFKEEDIKTLANIEKLNLLEMKETFEHAIENIDFSNQPEKALCEESFEFSIPEIPNITFIGKIDAIIKYKNGYKLVDYKTGRQLEPLKKLYSEEGVSLKNITGNNKGEISLSKIKGFNYQIFLYYLACKYSEKLKPYAELINEYGYIYVKPKYKNDITEDFILADDIRQYEKNILENLKKYVIDEIYKKENFEPQKNYIICKNCSFKELCDTDIETEFEE